MKRLCLLVLLTGCYHQPSGYVCGMPATAHPTMTTAAVTFGQDERVQGISEGAKGSLAVPTFNR